VFIFTCHPQLHAVAFGKWSLAGFAHPRLGEPAIGRGAKAVRAAANHARSENF